MHDKVMKYDTVVQRILCKRDKTSSRRIQEIKNQLDATVISCTVAHLNIRDMYASIDVCRYLLYIYIYLPAISQCNNMIYNIMYNMQFICIFIYTQYLCICILDGKRGVSVLPASS